jgi:cytoskeletal protein CcmA (bactofilin family)
VTREATTTKPKEKVLAEVAPGEPGVVTIKARKSGKVLGTYDRAACKLTAGNKTFVFQTDGTVTYGDGTKIGSIDGQTFTTPRGEQIRCDEIGIMFVDKKNVGSIQNQKQAILGDGTFIDASDKMNGVVLAYFIFGYLHSNKQLVAIKDGYEAATMTYNPTDEEFYAEATKEIEKRHGSSSSGSSSSGREMSFRKNGSIVGRMLADGTVYVGGSIKGKIDGNNNIYVGGHIEGLLRGNEVLKNGHVVGTIDDDGTVRINGHIVGGIDPRTGDVRYNGSIVGRVEPLGDLKKAAVYYFFQFW